MAIVPVGPSTEALLAAPADESLGSVSLMYSQLQVGSGEAARHIWNHYFPRLSGLAARVLVGRRLPQSAEDAVQNAFFQFFQSVERGDYGNCQRREDLWRILRILTVQASRKLAVRELALKRGGGRVYLEADAHWSAGLETRVDGNRTSAQECDLICEEFLDRLDGDLREVTLLRLAGYTNPQIKVLLQCSLRSVERRMHLIRAAWTDHDSQ